MRDFWTWIKNLLIMKFIVNKLIKNPNLNLVALDYKIWSRTFCYPGLILQATNKRTIQFDPSISQELLLFRFLWCFVVTLFPLCSSAFHLSYNMLLNQMRSEDGDPEKLLRNSFYQFQADRAIPDLEVG